MTDYDAVVFDNDGVLVELTGVETLREAATRAFADVGVDDPPASFVDRVAEADLSVLDEVERRYDVAPDTYWASRDEWAARLQCELLRDGGKPLYGDVEAVRDMPGEKGIVSNNQQATVECVVERYGLSDAFDRVVGREMSLAGARRRKPDPHYLDEVLADLGAGTALYVGDSPTDVVTAERAGADAAFLRRPDRDPVTLDRDPAYRVADLWELADLLG
ncbi:MAG: HAD family hydrolase [Haloarculaceae archaeon]